MKKLSLISRIFICLILGIAIGLLCRKASLIVPIKILGTIGDLFKNFLSFVIPLIILAFIIPGIATLGKKSGKGLLITTIIAYASTIAAGLLAFTIGKILLPILIKGGSLNTNTSDGIKSYFTINMPPLMDIMTALILAFILGIGLSRIKNSTFLKCAQEFSDIILKVITKILIPFVPFYIGCIFAKLSYSGDIFVTLKSFGIVYIILFSLQIAYLLIQYSIAGIFKKKNPIKLLKNMLPAYLTAVGTQSSAATIPVNLNCVKSNGISSEIAEFVVPLCATIHLAGDTITLVLTSMAVMIMENKVPTFGMFMPFILMLGVTMIAAPGVPGGGVMAALGLLKSMIGFGGTEQSIMIALHAAQDSFGTATNVTGDGAIAAIVDCILNKKKNADTEEVTEADI